VRFFALPRAALEKQLSAPSEIVPKGETKLFTWENLLRKKNGGEGQSTSLVSAERHAGGYQREVVSIKISSDGSWETVVPQANSSDRGGGTGSPGGKLREGCYARTRKSLHLIPGIPKRRGQSTWLLLLIFSLKQDDCSVR